MSAENGFIVTVNEVNVAPILPVQTNRITVALTEIAVVNTATESNIHDALSYQLVSPPAGANIDVNNGIITWIPSLAQAPGTNVLTTVVTASNSKGTPSLTATNSFTVVVNTPQNTYTWTNTLGGDWRIASYWSPNGVPSNNDYVYIPNTRIRPHDLRGHFGGGVDVWRHLWQFRSHA